MVNMLALSLPLQATGAAPASRVLELASISTTGQKDRFLAGRIVRALQIAGYTALREVSVEVQERKVMLIGRVPTYYLKQVAQTVVLRVPGIHQIRNDLLVARFPTKPEWMAKSGST